MGIAKNKINALTVAVGVILLILSSCERIDFQQVEIGQPYVGLYQGKDCVVVLSLVEEGDVKGKAYFDEGKLVADPVGFSADLKRSGKGTLRIGGVEKHLTKVKLKKNRLEGTLDGTAFSFRLAPNEELPFKSQYKEPCYEVTTEQGRVYARDVQGYWKSYPETDESFAVIYLRKTPELLFKRSLDLDMDLYYPVDYSIGGRHPLLLLIHGGAFCNGYKQSIGYPEMAWHFAERGYVVASINYRMGFGPTADDVDRAGFRALQDAHAAVCYLIENADEFGIDPNLIFAAGSSAGAITALNLAFMRDENRPDAVVQEGTIGALSGDIDREFKVKAVANMWGAVHDLSMLANSPETGIIAFHGDDDHIVPYGYGYPFDGILDLHVDGILGFFGTSFTELVFNPMQGSKAIHDKAQTVKKANGEPMRSELHTCYGESIHHLHVDDWGQLTPYFFDTILPATTRFFCEELVGGTVVELKQIDPPSPWFQAVGCDNVDELHWRVEGGAILDQQDNKRKVLLFGDVYNHLVMVGGMYKNGVEFNEKLSF